MQAGSKVHPQLHDRAQERGQTTTRRLKCYEYVPPSDRPPIVAEQMALHNLSRLTTGPHDLRHATRRRRPLIVASQIGYPVITQLHPL